MRDVVWMLERRSERGSARGADAVLEGAAGDAATLTLGCEPSNRGEHRRWVGALVGVAIVVVLGSLIVVTRVSRDDRSGIGGADRSPASVSATWTPMEVPEDVLPNGATVASIVALGDRMIAAGNVYGVDVSVANPVVWTASNGGAWQRTWDAGAIVGGSSSIPHLALVGDEVWLLHAGTGGTSAWRSSDGVNWEVIELPESMRAVAVIDAAERDGAIVALSGDKYDRGDVLWRSVDGGATWERLGDEFGAGSVPSSIVATEQGFAVSGTNAASPRPTVWTSADGRTWEADSLSDKRGGTASVAADRNGNIVVAGDVRDRLVDWYRTGEGWVRADSFRATRTPGAPAMLAALSEGFVSFDARPDALRYSRDGRIWTKVVAGQAPRGSIVAIGADGDSAVVFVSQSDSTGRETLRPYRVDFS